MPTGIGLGIRPTLGGSAWNPSRLSPDKLIQRLDTFSYESSTIGGRSVITDSSRLGSDREPRQQRVYLFDGTNDYAKLGARLTTGSPTALTVAMWIKTSVSTGISFAAENNTTGSQRSWHLSMTAAGLLLLTISGDGSTPATRTSTSTINDNAWRHIAFVYNGSTIVLYIDGAVAAGTDIGSVPASLFNTSAAFILGGSGTGASNVMSGSLKGARIYSVAKSAAEIAAIYNQAATPTTFDTTGLLAHYACEEESGAIGYDSSGNGKHLTITNASTLPGGTFHATDSTLPHSMANEYGASYAITPQDNGGSLSNDVWWLSNETVPANTDGFVEFIVDNLSGSQTPIYGITTLSSLSTVNCQLGLECATGYNNGTSIRRYEAGVNVAVPACVLALGDRVRIDRTAGVMTVKVNGSVITTFSNPTTSAFRAAIVIDNTVDYVTCSSVNGAIPTTFATQKCKTSIRVIPRSLSTPAQDVLGNTIHYTGQVPHYATVEPPCITGDGSVVQVRTGAAMPDSGSVSFLYYHNANGSSYQRALDARNNAGSHYVLIITDATTGPAYSAGAICLSVNDGSGSTSGVANALTSGGWHLITVQTGGGTVSLSVLNFTTGSVSKTSVAKSPVIESQSLIGLLGCYYNGSWQAHTFPSQGRVCDLQVTTGGVTKTFPLQEGPGDAGTNRTLYGYASDGSAVSSGSLVNGTVSTIWANRCPYAKDYAVANGSRVSSGVTIPANPATGLAADGNALNRAAGIFANDANRIHRINFNPYTAAGLNGTGAETALAGASARQATSPADSKFRRTRGSTTFQDDRYFIAGTRSGYTLTGLSGSDKTNAEAYVA